MKAVILAGGLGTRISEETALRPKPMVEIGGKPILWHIMKIYSAYGINDFVICLGYKGYVIKEYFANYYRHMSDITFDLASNSEIIHNNNSEKWKVTLVETGENSMTGARIKKIKNYLKDEKDFCLTYGDGVCDLDISKLVKFHRDNGKTATLTAVRPMGRFGVLAIESDGKTVFEFQEKPSGDGNYVNGGFFVFSREIFDYIGDGDNIVLEQETMKSLAAKNQLMSFKHENFWYAMDNQRDKIYLENLWNSKKAPWKIW
ncbi:MAG: glucose-1-phosphate cytidylyltransferase [Alphaproteobacteria bacterium RIFCSPLOWO2_01_FULL_40_26]|nr:MAG: glucose-1-phosphate cytidylyltransferase [Alphaproteobacteria bacterium RIFCSPHIGHO2_02_FULL_40_34]OFW86062.1 MAG: glucose-1-phosphate cytidylyltransferase [Alphaproteobacteria bacterium RIFCSPHIGHO2_01_FULL_40_8]OFW95392.1 MAG: glucose-1-phosphate cytidylyltransferase [Alphaproteobacteria bacterium RIFCSPLOWO2_01_FULL_40_26]OFX10032.1 MAG: glucose-1-phosphate cytidylyltransferase [Alphaproteobacteria bacterium RIFCSPLOWO2_02_FULL_40_19]OFX11666.1 MAG: glucose-1-phosphate cytidylyltrans